MEPRDRRRQLTDVGPPERNRRGGPEWGPTSDLDGVTLRGAVESLELITTLGGPDFSLYSMAWSPDGRRLAIGSGGYQRVYEWGRDGEGFHSPAHFGSGFTPAIDWAPDGSKIAFSSGDTVDVWDPRGEGRAITTLIGVTRGHAALLDGRPVVSKLAWSPHGRYLATGASGSVLLRDTTAWSERPLERDERSAVLALAWSPSGYRLARGTYADQRLAIWDVSPRTAWNRSIVDGAGPAVDAVAWLSEDHLVVGFRDGAISVVAARSGKVVTVLEGHVSRVASLSISADRRLLASSSLDGTARVWRLDTGEPLIVIHDRRGRAPGHVAFHPIDPVLAVGGAKAECIRLWRVDVDRLLGGPAIDAVRYTTARVALVGDSGVGKTGLGWRLAHGEFKEHPSTHGQQFWVMDDLAKVRDDGVECEAVLWDLAGQPDYRLIHSLFLDDVDLVLLLFDATDRQDPLGAVDFWLNQLAKADGRPAPAILVAARVDRGTPTLSEGELVAFCRRRGIGGGVLRTSALTGEGLAELLDAIDTLVPWGELPSTVTTTAFKRVKDDVLARKSDPDRAGVLLDPGDLRHSAPGMTGAEVLTAVGHLETHGYVKVLRSSDGRPSILLHPELLANLSASVVLEARRNPQGLGSLDEDALLRGDYRLPELDGLPVEERELLLDAVTSLFVARNVCFREVFNDRRVFLVFPGLITEKAPVDDVGVLVEDVAYRVEGAVENVYASLVVLLGYTNTFVRTNQWRGHALYALGDGAGEVCGFRMVEQRADQVDLILTYGEDTPDEVRLLFQGLFERFLKRRKLRITRHRPVVCAGCSEQLERAVVMAQLAKGRDFGYCNGCGERLAIRSGEPIGPPAIRRVAEQQGVAHRRTAFETALVGVKAVVRDIRQGDTPPSCFVSYAWGVPDHERWVGQLAKDLRNAGIDVVFDRWHNPPGSSLTRFTDRILACDFVVVVGTPGLRHKYEATDSDPVVAAEMTLVNTRLRQPSRYGPTVIPVLLDGERESAFTPMLHDIVAVDVRAERRRFTGLFDLVWRIHDLPPDHPRYDELRASLTLEL